LNSVTVLKNKYENYVIFYQIMKEQNLECQDSGDTEEQSTHRLSAVFTEEAFNNKFNSWKCLRSYICAGNRIGTGHRLRQLTKKYGNPILCKQQSAIRNGNCEYKVSSAHKAVIIEKGNVTLHYYSKPGTDHHICIYCPHFSLLNTKCSQ
jgi:hypothetical protein